MYKRFVVFILLIAVLIILSNYLSIDQEYINSLLGKIPFGYSWAIFIFFYVVGTFFIWYLKDPLKVVGAVFFGAYVSTFLIYISEIINSFIFFNLSNILGKEFVENKIRGKFKRLYDKLENINPGWIFLLRALPLVPYRIQDMTFGLTKLSYRKYLLVVLIASPLRIFWIQFVLAGVKGLSVVKITQYFSENNLICFLSFIYFLITFVAAFRLKKIL